MGAAYSSLGRTKVLYAFKMSPVKNFPELIKTSPNTKKDWSKRPHKTSQSFKGDKGILTKKKLVLVSGTNV